ncbi:MAG: GMC family oxidoreductase [Cyanobacteriota bacterium]|nr:GMC family oxidoreductase [Cyanobacteriota bacterium]
MTSRTRFQPSDDPVDAVVVGAGASGGVAAMVLAEAGLKVLVLEAGPAWSAERALGREPLNTLRRLACLASGQHRLQANHPGYWKHNPQLFIDERRHPWRTPADAPFLWTRGRQVGGKTLTWGGITLRLSDYEFKAGQWDGRSPSWPIGHDDLDPYYTRLERLLGVHGQRDGLSQLPDGSFQAPLPLTPGEQVLRQAAARELGLPLIPSRGFAKHSPQKDGPWPRSSAQGSTLARALATGRVRVRSLAAVSHLWMEPSGDRAKGVVLVDGESGRLERVAADLVVLGASTIETLRILLHSRAGLDGPPLIDSSGQLGCHLMDHISSSRFFRLPVEGNPGAMAELSGAGSCFLPNTLFGPHQAATFARGYGLWAAVQRFDPPRSFKRRPDEALGFLIGHGEVLPSPANRVSLCDDQRDALGLPVPQITCRWGANEHAMVAHMDDRMRAVVAAAGGTLLPLEDLVVLPVLEPWIKASPALGMGAAPPGYYIHEVGGARMASAEEEGMVDPWNACWRAPNVLVVDGACWPSAGWQSPTLTLMALSWRACEAALRRKGAGLND